MSALLWLSSAVLAQTDEALEDEALEDETLDDPIVLEPMDEPSAPDPARAPEARALRLLGGVARWRDPGAELALALDARLAGPLTLRFELGSQLVRALPAEGAGAVGVVLPQGSVGLSAAPSVSGPVQPRAGLDLLGLLYLGRPLAAGPGLRLRAGLEALAGPVGLSLEGHAGAVYAPGLPAIDPRDPPVTALFGVRAGPVVRW